MIDTHSFADEPKKTDSMSKLSNGGGAVIRASAVTQPGVVSFFFLVIKTNQY